MTPAHSCAVTLHLLYYKNVICNIQSRPPQFSEAPPPPVASYPEIMTSIRFNIKQGKRGMLWMEMEEEICRWASVKCLHMLPSRECLWGERSGHLEQRERTASPTLFRFALRRLLTAALQGWDEKCWPECGLAPSDLWTYPLHHDFHSKLSRPMECKRRAGHTVASCLEDQNMFRCLQLCDRIFSMRSLHTNVQLI